MIVSEITETIVVDQTASEATPSTESTTQETSSQPTSSVVSSQPSAPTQNQNTSSTTSGVKFVHKANLETGISWDGVSPILYIYPDGSSGYEKREGARYEAFPGMWTTVYVWRDDYDREYGTLCPDCGQEVGDGCYHHDEDHYCSRCGVLVPKKTCHDCDGKHVKYCSDCGKLYGDGTNGTCISHWTGGDWVHDLCGATIPVDTCHTCGVPIEIEPLPGTTVNSPSQLTTACKERLIQIATSVLGSEYDPVEEAKLVSVYAFVLTDNTAMSTRSKCVCFFVYSLKQMGIDKTIYYTGKVIDLSIVGNGTIVGATIPSTLTQYSSEAAAVADYAKIGTDITKIG